MLILFTSMYLQLFTVKHYGDQVHAHLSIQINMILFFLQFA